MLSRKQSVLNVVKSCPGPVYFGFFVCFLGHGICFCHLFGKVVLGNLFTIGGGPEVTKG